MTLKNTQKTPHQSQHCDIMDIFSQYLLSSSEIQSVVVSTHVKTCSNTPCSEIVHRNACSFISFCGTLLLCGFP